MEWMNVDFLKAAKSGNVGYLRHPDLNASLLLGTTPQQNTALHIAVRFGHEEFVKEICRRDASMLLKANSRGETPLHIAATLGYASIVTFFIDTARAPTASQQCPDVEQPGDNEELRQLLRATNKKGDTALHEAVRNGHEDMALELLNALPELSNVLNGDGESVLYIAVTRPSYIVVNALVGESFLDRHGYKGPHGRTALHAAVLAGRKEIVQKLLQARAELTEEQDDTGSFPLHYAVEWSDSHMTRMILKVDFSIVYSVNKDGNSPLHLCARQGNVNKFHDIVKCCPDSVDLVDRNGKNVLHIAIENGKEKLVKHILEDKSLAGLINHRDNNGNTPLHTAAARKQPFYIINLLKKRTLNTKLVNDKGLMAFDVLFSETVTSRSKEDLEKLLIVGTLVATVTFAAAFALPGGYINDGPRAGGAVLGTKTAFKAFLLFDTLAMVLSTLAVVTVVVGEKAFLPVYGLVKYSFGAMGVAFGTGVYVVVAPDSTSLAALVLILSLYIPSFTLFQTSSWSWTVIIRPIYLLHRTPTTRGTALDGNADHL